MKRIAILSSFLFIILVISEPLHAQIFKKIGEEVSKRLERKIIRETGDAAEKGVDKVIEGGGDAIKGEGKNETTPKNGKTKSDTLPNNQVDIRQNSLDNGMGEIGKNYDFIPGERTLFETNFSETVIGNFPQNLEFRGGELSVISYSGGRSIAANSKGSSFAIKLSEKLPERFTIEFNEFNSEFVNNMKIEVVDDDFKPVGQHFIALNGYAQRTGVGAYKRGDITSLQETEIINKQMTPIRVMVDGTYVKVYVGTKRVANMPSANLGRSNTILFNFNVRDKPIYVSDIRIAAGGRSLYQTLESTGRVAIHDIHFATGKADILPESAETIEGVAELLQDHPDLKLLIEGHTDNTGDFQKNMQLSKDRAEAVKTYLIGKFNIDAGRLETMGLGQSRPTNTNDTEEGKTKNRRVEIVKI